jgi:hypothetical protein
MSFGLFIFLIATAAITGSVIGTLAVIAWLLVNLYNHKRTGRRP